MYRPAAHRVSVAAAACVSSATATTPDQRGGAEASQHAEWLLRPRFPAGEAEHGRDVGQRGDRTGHEDQRVAELLGEPHAERQRDHRRRPGDHADQAQTFATALGGDPARPSTRRQRPR